MPRARHSRTAGFGLPATALALVALAVLLRRFGLAGGWWHAPDRAILLALRHADDLARPIGPHWLDRAALTATTLGTGLALGLFVAIAAGALLAAGAGRRAFLLVAATASGGFAVDLLKHLVARTRPTLVPHLVEATSASFPSAHAANSMIVFLAIAALATLRGAPALRRYAIGIALLLALAVGASRVYLGVHWPSDVAAGWLFGLGWALAWWRLADRIDTRKARR